MSDGGAADRGSAGDDAGAATATGDAERVRVCAAAELEPGERRLVGVGGTRVGVFNVDGDYYALENECAHQGGPVCEGKVAPELVGEFVEPGERVRERHGDRPAIACPWHGWEYSLDTGRHLGAADIALDTYPVAVEDGVVYVGPEPEA